MSKVWIGNRDANRYFGGRIRASPQKAHIGLPLARMRVRARVIQTRRGAWTEIAEPSARNAELGGWRSISANFSP